MWDTNGNHYNPYLNTDTVGRSTNQGQTSDHITWTYALPNSQGGTSTYTVKTANVNVSTNFGVSGVTEYTGTIQVVTELDLPDGTKYSFGYDTGTSPGHYGELTSVTLPTGGTINYTYQVFPDAAGNKYTWLNSRQTPDGTWTYAPSTITSPACSSTQVNCQQKVTVTKPSGDQSVYTFTLNGGAWPTQVQYYTGSSSSGTLLATTTQCFSFVTVTNGQCSYSVTTSSPATNVTTTASTTTLPNAENSTTEYAYDSYGNVTQVSEWNFYSGTLPAAADRTTTKTYLNTSSYINANILNRPTSVIVKNNSGTILAQTTYSYDQYALTSVTGVVNHDDTNYGTGNSVRGNVTQSSLWLNTNNSWLTTTNYYDTLGNLIQTTDPSGNTITASYSDNYYNYSPSAPTSAYVTQITRPSINGANHIQKLQYYFGSGLPSAACGVNFSATCAYGLSVPQPDYGSFSYDSMGRTTAINTGDGGQTTLSYGTSTPINITATVKIDSTHNLVSTNVLDGLGRTSQTQTSSPQGTIYVDKTFDSDGRAHTVSNPHYSGSSPTDGITQYAYDGIDRITTLTQPSGGTRSYLYVADGPALLTKYTDEVGNLRNSWVDAFGRTTQVNLFLGTTPVRTQYYYDALNNLTKADESGSNWSNDRVRTFTYDSLSRQTSVSNPEANTINYTYNSNGNVLTEVNGRGKTITYQYDALNRITSRSYNDGVTATANFVYDACPSGGCPTGVSPQYPVGRMLEAYTSSAQTFYSYDVLGRNARQWQCTPVNCGTSFIAFTYTHNYAGGQTSISYNGNFTISEAYDAVDRITQLTDSNSNTYNPATIVSVSQFSPIGLPTQLSYGNGLAEVRAYNNRLQPTQLRVYTPPSTDLLNQTFTWTNSQSQNNGLLTGFAASGTGTPTFNRTYTYDGLNRLATTSSPADPSGCTGLSWTYDAWANRTNQTVTSGTCGQSSLTVNTNNHITNAGFGYDADGNSTLSTNAYGADPYQFDAENRITQFNNGPSSGGANYVYDANGRRIEKVTSSGQVHYFYDENGQVVVETDQNGNWTKDYAYMGGQHVAEFSGGQTYFVHSDHLGSTRTITSYQGGVAYDNDYLPFGEQILGGNFTTHKFAGYERDYESTLDYANARYYSSSIGRFMSVDAAPGHVMGPQSYNRYGYVQNDPAGMTDPTGMDNCSDWTCTMSFGGGSGGAGAGGWYSGPTYTGQGGFGGVTPAYPLPIGASGCYSGAYLTCAPPASNPYPNGTGVGLGPGNVLCMIGTPGCSASNTPVLCTFSNGNCNSAGSTSTYGPPAPVSAPAPSPAPGPAPTPTPAPNPISPVIASPSQPIARSNSPDFFSVDGIVQRYEKQIPSVVALMEIAHVAEGIGMIGTGLTVVGIGAGAAVTVCAGTGMAGCAVGIYGGAATVGGGLAIMYTGYALVRSVFAH